MGSRNLLVERLLAFFTLLLYVAVLMLPSITNALDPQTGANGSSRQVSTSSDSRYSAFESIADNLTANDTNGLSDIFVFDSQTDTVTIVSTTSSGSQSTGGGSAWPAISSTGRYIAFESSADNLVASDTNGLQDIFVKDTQIGTTSRVSTTSAAAEATGGASSAPAISANGRYVVFASDATNLVAGDTNATTDIFLKDTQTGTLTRVSTDSSATQSVGGISNSPEMSSDGRYIVFESLATNLVAGDTNASYDVFRKDTQTGTTSRVSTDSSSAQATGGNNFRPTITPDGRYVAFYSSATNLVAGDTNSVRDIFVKDIQTGAINRVSTDSLGTQSNGQSYFPKISADGRYVAFESGASNLVAGDTNARFDAFLKDTLTGTTTRVSTSSLNVEAVGGNFANSPTSDGIDISDDGRYVAFNSLAANLHADDTNENYDIFLKDTQTGVTKLVSTNGGQLIVGATTSAKTPVARISSSTLGVAGNNDTYHPDLSADGRYVVFESYATNLVADDTNAQPDIFIKDSQTGTTTRVSTDSSGAQSNGQSSVANISADGRYVIFDSDATNLVAGDTNAVRDVFLKDTQTGTTTRVSTSSTGTQATQGSYSGAISADGRYVAFDSYATNLVAGDTNGQSDIFIKDTQTGTTTRVSTDSSGAQSNGYSGIGYISADGRYVAFDSSATNLVAGDTNAEIDIFLKDTQTGTTTRVSSDDSGAQSNGESTNGYIAANGRYVIFNSTASNLVAGDTNGERDVFHKDTQTGIVTVVSSSASGVLGNSYYTYATNVSADGRYVTFESYSSNLVPGDTNGNEDVFIKDTITGITAILSTDSFGVPGNNDSEYGPISADGRYVAFLSYADNFLTDGIGGDIHIYHRLSPFVTTATDDDFTGETKKVVAGNSTSSVLSNDIRNGSSVNPSDYILSVTDDGGLTNINLNSNGTLSIPAATPAGTYNIVYEICEAAALDYCQTATVTVAVLGASISGSLADTGLNMFAVASLGILIVIFSAFWFTKLTHPVRYKNPRIR
ncbi:MAG: hypothetical protein M3Q79_02560 [bacterium]|nr:hypothetical protein [bacterium]